ncbi:cAMP-responsive element modulator-like [Sinocyclocheilus grahami]|nr:PREDICTED: cAMP-responsive element modulator-like [Sinocyclocheilus grahami]
MLTAERERQAFSSLYMAVTGDETESATTGGMSAYQISSPASGLSQAMDGSPGSLPSPQQLTEEASHKRELRLVKNRYCPAALPYSRITTAFCSLRA